MTTDWTHPHKLTREEVEEIVVRELLRRGMEMVGPPTFEVQSDTRRVNVCHVQVRVVPREPSPLAGLTPEAAKALSGLVGG